MMSVSTVSLAVLLSWSAAGAPTPSTPSTSTSSPRGVAETPCRLSLPAGLRLDALCGVVRVPVDSAAADGPTLTVGYAHLVATGLSPSTTPLVLLSGGPGQAATRDFVALSSTLDVLRQDRDLYLFDIRGTGRSTPVACADDTPVEQVFRTVRDDAADARDAALLKRCWDEMPFPPRTLTTRQLADDLEVVRQAWGHERLHVLGVSYGTRLAVAYAQAHPEHTASLVLDGVVPLDRPLGPDIAADMSASLEALGSDVVADFVALKKRFQATPVDLIIPHPRSASPTPIRLTDDLVNSAVRMALYADETRALIPAVLRQAVASAPGSTSEYAPLAGLAMVALAPVSEAISTPVNVSIICAEDVPRFADHSPDTSLPFADEVASLQKACTHWPVPKAAPIVVDAAHPLTTPTLALSGVFDPITPPRHMNRDGANFSALTHIEVPGHGHNVFPRGCVPGVINDVLLEIDARETAKASGAADDAARTSDAPTSSLAPGKDLDLACVQRQRAFPVFVDLLGPNP